MFASSFCAKDFLVARKRATTEQIRAMVHPIRWRIVEAVDDGPQTATTIGEALGLSSGVTSYHLRVLAEAEVIEEAPELGKGRERWWRASRPRPYVPTDAKTPEERASRAAARLYHLERDDETLLRFMRAVRTLSPEWQDAAFTGSWSVRLSREQTFELGLRFLALVDVIRDEQRPAGDEDAREIVLTMRALPWLEPGS
jgi:DNA-binding transcriptional ArsR family regulator